MYNLLGVYVLDEILLLCLSGLARSIPSLISHTSKRIEDQDITGAEEDLDGILGSSRRLHTNLLNASKRDKRPRSLKAMVFTNRVALYFSQTLPR